MQAVSADWLHCPFARQFWEGRGPLETLQEELLIFLSGAKPARPPVAHLEKCTGVSYNRAGTLESQITTLQ